MNILAFAALLFAYLALRSFAGPPDLVTRLIALVGLAATSTMWFRLTMSISTSQLKVRNLFRTYNVALPASNVLVFTDERCYLAQGSGDLVTVWAVDGVRTMGVDLGMLDPRFRLSEVELLVREICPDCIRDAENSP